MNIATHIRVQAKKAGGMSAYARETGVSRSQLYKLIAGKNEPSTAILKKLGLKMVKSGKRNA